MINSNSIELGNQSRWREAMKEIYPSIDETFLAWLIDNGYFTAPASTKHHGSYIEGLFQHSRTVAKELLRYTEKLGLVWENDRSPAVIGLFHDICKIDQYKPSAILYSNDRPAECVGFEYVDDTLLKGHGDKSVMILASHLQLTEEEVMCIRYHMGAFTDQKEWADYTRAIEKYPNVLWTHQADMVASKIFLI